LEKSFDAVKEIDNLVWASTDIFSRLRVTESKQVVQRNRKDTNQEKNANPRKNNGCWSECLKGKY
jgi:hypothetical protein